MEKIVRRQYLKEKLNVAKALSLENAILKTILNGLRIDGHLIPWEDALRVQMKDADTLREADTLFDRQLDAIERDLDLIRDAEVNPARLQGNKAN